MDEERHDEPSDPGEPREDAARRSAPGAERRSGPGVERSSGPGVERSSGPGVERHGEAEATGPSTIWEGLIAGEFSLVEQFERNGHVYMVARRNDPPGPHLTLREREVVARAARGLSNEQIAARSGLTSAAVAAHLANAAQKLGVASRSALVDAAAAFSPDDEGQFE